MLLVLSAIPFASHAGFGYYITIKNELNAGASRPYVTIHKNNGSSCWTDDGLADWAQYAMPGQSVRIYTEQINSGSCNINYQDAIRGVGLFAGATGVPWAPIWKGQAGPNDFKIVSKSGTEKDYLEQAPPIGLNLGHGICVKSYTNSKGQNLNFGSNGKVYFADGKQQSHQFDEAIITISACGTLKASDLGLQINNDESVAPPLDAIPAPTNSYVNPKPIYVKVGQTVNVTVPTKYLNSDTEWDLGGCSSDGAIQKLQFNHNKKGQRLAETLQITGVTPGSLTCALNANDYDEIGNVWPVVQQVYNVVVR